MDKRVIMRHGSADLPDRSVRDISSARCCRALFWRVAALTLRSAWSRVSSDGLGALGQATSRSGAYGSAQYLQSRSMGQRDGSCGDCDCHWIADSVPCRMDGGNRHSYALLSVSRQHQGRARTLDTPSEAGIANPSAPRAATDFHRGASCSRVASVSFLSFAKTITISVQGS